MAQRDEEAALEVFADARPTGVGDLPRNDTAAVLRYLDARQPDWPTPDKMKSLFQLQDDPERLRRALIDAIEEGRLAPAPRPEDEGHA